VSPFRYIKVNAGIVNRMLLLFFPVFLFTGRLSAQGSVIDFKVTKVSCKGTSDGAIEATVKEAGTFVYYWKYPDNSIKVTSSSSISGLKTGSYTLLVVKSTDSTCFATNNTSVGKEDCPPPPKPPDPFTIPVTAGGDPNDITGPNGFGDPRWVSVNDILPYRVRFENDPKIATAAANKIIVTHPIDPAANMFSFRLGPISFRNFVVDVPSNTSHFFKHLDLTDSIGVFVDITAGLDVTKKQAFWIFQAFDSATGLPNINPELGILLVNDSITHNGEGAVNFSIKPKITSATGDSIKAYADIIFDVNAVIRTNVAFNTIDALPPVSKIKSITPVDAQNVQLAWNSHDDPGGSGVARYKLLVSTNNDPYITFKDSITDTSLVMKVMNGNNYKLQVIAQDNANNIEAIKSVPDTTLEIKSDDFFITPAHTSVTCVGSPLKITWKNISDVAAMSLQLSGDSGKTYTSIGQSIYITDSVFTWNVPAGFTGNKYYVLRAVNSATQLVFATSGYFLIRNNTLAVQAGQDRELCASDSTLLGGDPTASNGIEPYLYAWSPSESLKADSTSNPNTYVQGDYIVKVTDSLGCSNSDTVRIITHSLPNIYVYGIDSVYYLNSPKSVLFANPEDGEFFGPGITDKVFNPALAGVGSHTITYTITNEYGCWAYVNLYTKVLPVGDAMILGLDSVYCINASPATLTGMPPGGAFSGSGMTGTLFNPSVAGAGTHEIKYAYTDSTGSHEVAATTTVYLSPSVSFIGLDSGYYLNDMPDSLTGTPSGGTFAGAGISGTVFSPTLAGAGTHTITYTYTDGNGCSNSSASVTTVNGSSAVNVSGSLTYNNADSSPLGKTGVYLRNINGSTTDTALTDSAGRFSIAHVEQGDFILSAKTDIGWGGVNATDALIVKKHAIGAFPLSDLRRQAADVNLSNAVNATDALTISKRTIGLISSFPAGDWVFEKDSVKVQSQDIIHDFQGICTGDVNGSYLPPTRSRNETVTLIYSGKISVVSNQDFEIPVKTTADITVGAITLGLTYPADLIEVKGVYSKAKGLIHKLDNGTVKIAWADPIPVTFSKNDSIVILKCSGYSSAAGTFQLGLSPGGELAGPDATVIQGVVLSSPTVELNLATGNNNGLEIPKYFSLSQNYPNPFSKITEMEYELPEAGDVTLTIYNLLGVSISEVIHAHQPAGKYIVKYDGTSLASGVYVYEIKIAGTNSNFTQSRIMSISK